MLEISQDIIGAKFVNFHDRENHLAPPENEYNQKFPDNIKAEYEYWQWDEVSKKDYIATGILIYLKSKVTNILLKIHILSISLIS